MKKFYAFVQKEFYHIFRDTRTMMILFALPVALVIIFGYALNNDYKNIPIGVLNQSKDQTSEKLINRIIGSGYFVVEKSLEKPQANSFFTSPLIFKKNYTIQKKRRSN
jgi:ABC-2 type transport system permease protein